MISFSKPVQLDKASMYYSSSGDLATAGNAVVAAWSYNDGLLYLQAADAATRELGPELTVPITCYVSALVEGDDTSVWMCVQESLAYKAKLGRIIVDPSTLQLSLDWMVEFDIDRLNDMWLMHYRDRIIVAGNCGNLGDPSDPSQDLYSQLHMFDLAGTPIDQAPAMVQSGNTWTEWLDTVAVNPWTNEILGLSAIYSSGYHESAWTMPITEAGFGSWARQADLYVDYAIWATAIGTPLGWHALTMPNGPRYAEILTLDTSLNRRGRAVLADGGAVDSYQNSQHAKVYDMALRNGRVVYACHEWGYTYPARSYGLVLGYGGVDSAQPLTEVTHVPRTDQAFVDSMYLSRVASTPDGWMYMTGERGYSIPGKIGSAFRHYLWGASPLPDHFPDPVVAPDEVRTEFRRPL